MSSRESTPLSSSGVDNIHEDTVTDKTLKGLLRREIELQQQIDAVQAEISQLEEQLGTKAGDDVDETGNKKKTTSSNTLLNCIVIRLGRV